MKPEALERYRELPLPDTTEEHWRFTDLKGFDPDSFGRDRGQSPAVYQPRVSSSCEGSSVVAEMPTIGSPRPADTRASTAASM